MRVNDYKEAVTEIISYGTETTDADGKPFKLIIGRATAEQLMSTAEKQLRRNAPRPQTDGK